MLPFLLWVAAATGYFILVAEVTIAVNIWAVAHLWLDGEGFAGEAARQGYYLLLALALTPTQMVFGFILGMSKFKETAMLIGLDMAIRGLPHYQSWVVWRVAELPGKVLRWVGANADVSSKEDDRIRATALGGAAATSGVVREVVRRAVHERFVTSICGRFDIVIFGRSASGSNANSALRRIIASTALRRNLSSAGVFSIGNYILD